MLTITTYILLQAPTGGGGGYTQFIFIGIMLLVLYLFMIRPQQRRQKEQKRYIEALQVGDEVISLGGMHGKIVALQEKTLVIEIDKGVKVTVERSAISYEASKRKN